MKRSRFSEEQILGILHQAEAGRRGVHWRHQHGISAVTFYKWLEKFGIWMCLSQAPAPAGRGNRPGQEDGRLTGAGDVQLQGCPLKKLPGPASYREAVRYSLQKAHTVSSCPLRDTWRQPQHCAASASTGYGCRSAPPPEETAEVHRRFGFQRQHVFFAVRSGDQSQADECTARRDCHCACVRPKNLRVGFAHGKLPPAGQAGNGAWILSATAWRAGYLHPDHP